MVGGSGQMNFLIHNLGSPGDYDSWNVPGWDSQAMKDTFDRLTCWSQIVPIKKPTIGNRQSMLLDGDADMCTAPMTTGKKKRQFFDSRR